MRNAIPTEDLPSHVASIEQALASAGIGVNEFCQRAEINRATWQRWKAGKNRPHPKMWRGVQDALGNISSDKAA